MVSDQSTRVAQKMLRSNGWIAIRTSGSHTVWSHPSGKAFTLPDGHRRISAGVYKNLLRALEETK